MTKAAVEHLFTGVTGPIASYDKTKTLIGTLMRQNTGVANTDKWIGPKPLALARPMEQSVAIPVGHPYVVTWSPTIDYVFLADIATAAATRRIVMYEFNKVTMQYTWKGFITLNFVAATGTKTIRSLRAMITNHSTGTVAVAGGTGVTGVGTQFQSDRIAEGARIGFGTTDPTQVTQWFEIATILGNGSLTLSTVAPDAPAGTPYVIEELRVAVAITSSTNALGAGLFVAKGLNIDTFNATGTTINEASATDNVRGIFWLADGAPVTNIIAAGLAVDTPVSATEQYAYIIDGSATAKIYKYNLRAALGGLAAGKSTSAFVLVTGVSAALAGTLSAQSNMRIAQPQHGPGAGVKSLYFVTTTRVYRAALAGILSGATNFLNDSMVEVPPGSINTYTATAAFSSVDYSDSLDKFIIMSTGAAGIRSYITKYTTLAEQFEHIFLVDTKQQDQVAADVRVPPLPSVSATVITVWSQDGIFHFCRNGTTAALNQLYALPIGADWAYAATTLQRVITPELLTPNAARLIRGITSHNEYQGEDFGITPTEPFRVYARTSGIDDNSGAWTLLDTTGSLSALTPSASIQFMLEFRTIGLTCLTTKVHSVAVIYEDATTDSHYQVSLKFTSATTKQFAWRFATAFGGVVPDLRIRIYDAITGGGPLVDDNTATPAGTWEKSTDDGLNWVAYNTTDKVNETTYIRYTPVSLPDNIKVRALLTQN